MRQHIVVNKNTTVNKDDSNNVTIQKIYSRKFFGQFLDSQKNSQAKPFGLSIGEIVTLQDETSEILSYCNPYDAVDKSETTHLVVGYVQSGKTLSFTGLTALALDNGYRIIVYLAGTKNNLLDQTCKRLQKDLIKIGNRNNDYYKIYTNAISSDLEDIVGHLESDDNPIILIPILKHHDHIDRLKKLFDQADLKNAILDRTVLIIDDEADQASLNSYGRKNSKTDSEEDLKSRTYDSILKLRSVLPGNSYVQYTATPQANILISMRDMLSPKTHTILTPGNGYIGGKLFFGKGVNCELYNGGLIVEIPKEQVFHKTRNPLKTMPESLRDALMFHILAVAIIVQWQKSESVTYLSMMVHPDNTKKWNKVFKKWIDNELRNWRKALQSPDGHDEKISLLERFEKVFPKAVEYYNEDERPAFNEIRPLISSVLSSKKVYLVNTDKDAETDICWDKFKMHILVGAEMLNRGFTVEKLATTYMPRYTIGPSNADTIQQRCRFFGYKRNFIKSCRVFLPSQSTECYYDYIDHEEELRTTLRNSDSLASAERKILLSPRLRPTRQNVLPISVVNTDLRGMRGMQAFTSKNMIESNTQIVDEFLSSHEDLLVSAPITEFPLVYTTKDRTHRGFKLPIDDAITFLDSFRFGNYKDARRKSDTVRYLRYLEGNQSVGLKYVYFVQMAYDADIRHREFDANNNRLAVTTDLFAGPSSVTDSTNYPGDRKIVGADSITIQLYKFALDKAPLDFAHEAYTLAINYPEKLAANYCSNEQGKQEEDFDNE